MSNRQTFVDLSDKYFGNWHSINQAGNNPRGGTLWNCICKCGTERVVSGDSLKRGTSRSCGCLRVKAAGGQNLKHGARKRNSTELRIYYIWQNMRRRCKAKSGKYFSRYTSRGITVCPEWDDFGKFHEWAKSSAYRDDLTIERKDNDKGYNPDNCTWATKADQNRNKSNNHIAPDGELYLHKAIRNGIKPGAFRLRVSEGWPLEQASTQPMRKRREPLARNAESGRFK